MSNTNRDIEDCRSTLERYYEKGLNDAWELARKICGATDGEYDNFSTRELYKIFDMSSSAHIINENTYQEALAKLETYEKEQNEIKVGDVVTVCGEKGIVVGYLCGLEEYEVWMDGYERPQRICKNEIKKTGKHIDIQSVLEQIKE